MNGRARGGSDREASALARLRARAAAARERGAGNADLSPPTEDDWTLDADDDPVRHRLVAPRRLGEHLAPFLQRRGWSERLEGASLASRWVEVVGPELARVSEPVRLAGGVLVVRVADAAWATELRYLVGRVRDGANRVLADGSVREVRLVVGRLEGGSGDR